VNFENDVACCNWSESKFHACVVISVVALADAMPVFFFTSRSGNCAELMLHSSLNY